MLCQGQAKLGHLGYLASYASCYLVMLFPLCLTLMHCTASLVKISLSPGVYGQLVKFVRGGGSLPKLSRKILWFFSGKLGRCWIFLFKSSQLNLAEA